MLQDDGEIKSTKKASIYSLIFFLMFFLVCKLVNFKN